MTTADQHPVPTVSIVIASLVGSRFLADCLGSLEGQAREIGAEVIVVACGTGEVAEGIGRDFPWVRVIHRPERETVPELRRRGVVAARGETIAIIEEHCVASPNWLRTAHDALTREACAAVGGAVWDDSYRRLTDWVVYFIEYNISLPPVPRGDTTFLNGANIAYRRSVLLGHEALLSGGYWEATLHPILLSEGERLVSVPEMIVRHRGPFGLVYYLGQRFWFSRGFAGARRDTMPFGRRLAYCVVAPLLPFVLLARIGMRVWSKRCKRARFLLAAPLILPALVVYVVGECVGYLAGPGDALLKVE
jgi:glycosyltransferase involved in cell wall biosynthesis